MNKPDLPPKPWLPLGLYLFINLLQAIFTGLGHDEAYYAYYGTHLSAGYFEQAPMVGWLTWLGQQLLPGEAGVRLLFVLLGTGTQYLLWRLVRPQDAVLYWLLVFSVPLVHFGGFFAAPDVPLLFFTLLFLHGVLRWQAHPSWGTAALTGLALAAMAWSKYQGVLPFVLLMASLWPLRRHLSLYLIPLLALVIFLPYLYWLHMQDYATVYFHWVDRSPEGRSLLYPLEFLGMLLVLLGPLVQWLWAVGVMRNRDSSPAARSLRIQLIGSLVILLVLSFRHRVEGNWAATAFLPLIWLGYRGLERTPRLRVWALRLGVASVALMLLLRVWLIWDFLPGSYKHRKEFQGWPEWAAAIDTLSHGAPVVFSNGYQKPAEYLFYGKSPVFNFHDMSYGGNEFAWDYARERAVQGKTVYWIDSWDGGTGRVFLSHGNFFEWKRVENWRSYQTLACRVAGWKPERTGGGRERIQVSVCNPSDAAIVIADSGAQMVAEIFQKKASVWKGGGPSLPQGMTWQPGECHEMEIALTWPTEPEFYRLKLGIQARPGMLPSRNGHSLGVLIR